MSESSPPLLPIFRSRNQLTLLGEMFLGSPDVSVAELARRSAVPQATVSREIARLARAGVVATRPRGRMTLVSPNERAPYFAELRALLLKIVGPLSVLADTLGRVEGIDEASIFGSWARRYLGEWGDVPADLDVVIVGAADPDAVDEACTEAERTLTLQVNPIVLSRTEWEAPSSGFVEQVRSGPRVPIHLERT